MDEDDEVDEGMRLRTLKKFSASEKKVEEVCGEVAI
jgi:hypothetical protein